MERSAAARILVLAVVGMAAALLVAAPLHATWPYLVTGLLTAALLGLPLWRVARRVGPRNLLHLSFPLIAVVTVLIAAEGVLRVTGPVLYVYGAVGGLASACVAAAEGAWPGRLGPGRSKHRRHGLAAFASGALAGLLVLGSLGLLPLLLLVTGLVAGCWFVLHRLADPVHPDDPLRHWIPWGDGSGRTPSGWRRWLAPVVLLYLVVSWALFLPVAEPHPDGFHVVPREIGERYGFEIPELIEAPGQAALAFLTAPFLNHDSVQLVYVTVLLLLFGLPFERREGSLRFIGIFFGTGAAAALIAGLLLHLIHPVIDHPALDDAWRRIWSGGSAGAFGILGAVAARAPTPWPLLGFFAFWELNVGWWFLQSYTPAFHVTALGLGFVVTRFALTPHSATPPPRD